MRLRASALTLCMICGFLCAAQLAAQEKPEQDSPLKIEWIDSYEETYEAGDNVFTIDAGVLFPLSFTDGNGTTLPNKNYVGGTGHLIYQIFLNKWLFAGGEFSGSFSATLGENVMYTMPFGATIGANLKVKSFEFPFSLTVGGILYSYMNTNYFGMYIKPTIGAFWRFNREYSFGINASYLWNPQWTADPATTVNGHMMSAVLAVRYHF